LELARVLAVEELPYEVWLTFFDAEDNGNLDGWPWCVGSRYMAEHLQANPWAVVVVDMVGDVDQAFYYETNSEPRLQRELWDVAAGLGYGDVFFKEKRWTIYDDHVPFAERGIPAAVIIDFDYVHWHTAQDTRDKVGTESLERVGRVLEAWLESSVGKGVVR
jgi:Zn-dependent M28 family amino/carboxypeptidase